MGADDESPPGHPVGQPVRWSSEDIARLAVIDADDEARARALWRRHAGAGAKSLLDAKADQRVR